ncbi:ABC transporter permease [Chitinophaga sp. CF418]|uniref:ABC transporter permease n=1 Tax=Chitinophaga sp. CF418 TaxID=1855287 RepID=UPI000918496B|nr:ABC transporter permease [Chitinophaga sp. CF418]SHN39734.1 FtsX-like permease family protein [Chitinophaga sp. CF418]
MLRNAFKIAWRHLLKDRQFTFLNLIGLSTGLACTIFICLWVWDEWQTDRFHQYDGRLFQVMINEKNGDQVATSTGTDGALGHVLARQMPEVEYAVTTTPPSWFQQFNVSYKENTVGATGNFVSGDFFRIFSYKLIEGSATGVLADKNSLVISASLARRLFNTTSHVTGRTLAWKWLTFSKQCTISGVYEDMPVRASERFDFVLPFEAWKEIVPVSGQLITGSGPFNTYVVLKKGMTAAQLDRKLNTYVRETLKTDGMQLFLRRFSDGYLYGKYDNGVQAGGRIAYVKLFSLIALFILLLACINFMNLSTAKVSGRMKEIGVKKTLGAGRGTFILQFLGESLMMTTLSLLGALLLVILLLPQFNILSGKTLSLQWDAGFILAVVVITLLTGFMAGSYPALYLSRLQPVNTLKGKTDASGGSLWARKGLVIFQFTISVGFIIAVLVVNKQVRFVETKQPGYDKDNVICFEMKGRVAAHYSSFLSALKNVPGVVNASSIEQQIIMPTYMPSAGVSWEGKNTDGAIRFYQMPVNFDLIETLDVQMAAGRPFSAAYRTDSTAIVLNEAAVRVMGLSDPIGKEINIYNKPRHVVGVVKNFHFNSLHEAIRPFIFRLAPSETLMIMARIAKGQERATIDRIISFYKQFNPGYVFDYTFLDASYQRQYAAEKLVASLSQYFTGLAILISCLGLFGLTAFTAERRRKEIGIRKVLGATVSDVVWMLSLDFLKLVLIAVGIAFPLSVWVMENWLNDFAYRVSIGAPVYLGAGAAVLVITLLTISFQAMKAALTNPVKSLKME